MKNDAGLAVSAASERCKSAIPSRSCVSSRDLGWTSLLVDIHTGMAWNEVFTSVTTLDPRISVCFSGHWLVNFFSKGSWRTDVSKPGTTTVLRIEDQRRFRLVPLKNNDCHFALVYLPLDQLAATADHLRRPGQRLLLPSFDRVQGQDRAVAQVVRALVAAMERGDSELYAETTSAWLAAHLLIQKGPFAPYEDDRSVGHISDARLCRAIEFISVHFGERITLERLATEAGISKYHFTRMFREKVGQTPCQFLSETRLTAAKKMLTTTNLRIGEIALICGYTAASHFTTAFSASYRINPMRFRASQDLGGDRAVRPAGDPLRHDNCNLPRISPDFIPD